MSSYNIYGSNSSSQGNGSVGVSSRSSLTGDRESYSSRIRSRDIDNGTYEDSTSCRLSGSRSPRHRRGEENSESKIMQNLHIGQVPEEGASPEGASASPKQRLKDRKGASASPSSNKFKNRRMREKRRGTGKVVVEDDGFMDELAKENAAKNAMISSTGDNNDVQTSPVSSRELQQKDDDENDEGQSRVEKRRAARQRRQAQEEGTDNGGSSSPLINNDRPNRDRRSGLDSGGLQQKLDLANLTISHLNDEVDRLKKEVSSLKEDRQRERDEKGSLLKAMTSLTR